MIMILIIKINKLKDKHISYYIYIITGTYGRGNFLMYKEWIAYKLVLKFYIIYIIYLAKFYEIKTYY